VITAALSLLAFLLRIYRLDYVPLRGDESFTVIFLSDPLPVIWHGIRFIEPNPPLFYLLLYAFMALAGTADFATRYFSLIFGVLAVPLVYVLARRLTRASGTLTTPVATIAALLVAINPYQIWHSQDLRNYTVWPALSLASLYLLLRVLDEDRPRFWLGYILATILSLYTHYYDVFLLAFQNVYVFATCWRRPGLLKRWIVVQAVVVAAFAPWPLFLSSRPLTYVDITEVPDLPELVLRTLTHFTLGETLSQSQVTAALPVMGLLVLLGLVMAFRVQRRVFWFLALYLGIPLLGAFVAVQIQPVFRERYLNAMAPAYYLALAFAVAGLTRLRAGKRVALALTLGVVLVINGVSLGQYFFNPTYAKSPDWRALARYLEAHAGPRDVIVQTYPDPGLAHYYHGPAERLVLPDRSAVDQVGELPVDRVATGQRLRELLERYDRLWLIPVRSNWDPQAFVEGWLERRAEKVAEERVADFRVVVYREPERQPLSFQHSINVHFGDSIRLLGYDLVLDVQRSELHVTLYWEALGTLDIAYTVFTHLVDSAGVIRAQHDAQPQGGDFPTTEWLPGDVIRDTHVLTLADDMPPGEYRLLVGLYRLDTGARLPALDASGRRWPNDAVALEPAIRLTR